MEAVKLIRLKTGEDIIAYIEQVDKINFIIRTKKSEKNTNNINDNYNLISNENIIELNYENIKLIFTLKFSSNNITNNIPVKYYINLINLI